MNTKERSNANEAERDRLLASTDGDAPVANDSVKVTWTPWAQIEYSAHLPGKNEADDAMILRRSQAVFQIIPEARYKLVQSDDDVKRDLELHCLDCGHHLCDAEPDDSLWVLASVAIDHEVRRHS